MNITNNYEDYDLEAIGGDDTINNDCRYYCNENGTTSCYGTTCICKMGYHGINCDRGFLMILISVFERKLNLIWNVFHRM